jgi:hydrogenase nickel incorporation protein HypA/HybF
MHEASAAEALVKMVLGVLEARPEAVDRGARRVTRISLVVGEATGYMRESLEFYVAASAKGSLAEGAALEIAYVKSRMRCPSCGLEYERRRFSFDCPSCGTQGTMTRLGSEFYVDSIEIDAGPSAEAQPPLEATA